MKILQLIQKPQPRGAETFAAQLSENLEQQGHSSKLVALFSGNESVKFKKDYMLVGANAGARLWDANGWKKLADIISNTHPDVIQANAGDTLKYAVFSKVKHKWHQPIIFRNASTLSSYLKNPVQKIYSRFLLNRVDAIASVSEFSRCDIINLFPELAEKTLTIPIGLEPKIDVSNPFINNSSFKTINLVHVGGFTFEKNHLGLLRIYERITKLIPNVHLWLIGDGPLRNEVEAAVQRMGLLSCVSFTGFISNPLEYIAHGDALLLPSIIEGLPGVILEAMLYETPVIATNVGGISEIVIPNKTGWLIERGEEKAFAEAVSNCLANKNETLSLVKHAVCMVEEKYMNKSIANSFANLYQKLSDRV